MDIQKIFTSKANVLRLLQKKIKKAKIEKIFTFTVSDWNKKEFEILNYIYENFNRKIVVRSSAIGEDSLESSQAGSYESILNVNPSSKKELQNSINSIINSYITKGNKNTQNQILIQDQTQDIITSGVVLTSTADIGSPYYVINFEEGSSTTGVTMGFVGNTIKIFRNMKLDNIPEKWRFLIKSIREIESILKHDLLDIEFGITQKNKVVIFQVRPMTFVKQRNAKVDSKIAKLISKSKKLFVKLNAKKHVPGNSTMFSDMSDWNPSEIIGNNPNFLDYSLYDFLIMNKAWHKGRSILGYQNVDPYPLMVRFGNKPYVDVRSSFNSLIPNKIPNRLKNKLMKFYLYKLSKFPYLHDKVEFEILFSCYDMMLNSRLKELEEFGFTKYEIKQIRISLLDFTNKVIENFPQIFNECQVSIEKLSKNRIKIKSELDILPRNHQNLLYAVEKLLLDCRRLGTIPFAMIARISFIGSILLKSLQNRGYVDSHYVESFMNSVSTPLSEIQDDLAAYGANQISKKQFLIKYGHLRPGTYDITALRYDMKSTFFDKIKFERRKKKFKFTSDIDLISRILANHNLKFKNIDFLTFVKDSLVQREKLKFEFTKNLSDALEFIAEAGRSLGFTRKDLSNLEIKTILHSKNNTKTSLKKKWKDLIVSEKKRKLLNNYLILPPLIFSEKDFEIIHYYISKPNFITTKKVTSGIINLKHFNKNTSNLENKLILIENADPGYDWIFTRNPAGLITKYGGIASHMAIRCAEIGLPAAIGCGEIFYEKLVLSSKVLLDCKNKEVLILEHTKKDEYVEERRVLKSLGYIK